MICELKMFVQIHRYKFYLCLCSFHLIVARCILLHPAKQIPSVNELLHATCAASDTTKKYWILSCWCLDSFAHTKLGSYQFLCLRQPLLLCQRFPSLPSSSPAISLSSRPELPPSRDRSAHARRFNPAIARGEGS